MHSPEIKVLEEKRNVSAQKSISRTSPTNIFRIEYAHNQRKVTKKTTTGICTLTRFRMTQKR